MLRQRFPAAKTVAVAARNTNCISAPGKQSFDWPSGNTEVLSSRVDVCWENSHQHEAETQSCVRRRYWQDPADSSCNL